LSSPLPLHRAPGAGFDQPFEMLAACHERVERMLVLLERLAEHLPRHGADAQARDAARDIMRYFDQAAPHHHEDEERHVLPALRASGAADDLALAERLHADHETMALAWQALRTVLAAIEQGEWAAGAAGAGGPEVASFAALYREHMTREDGAAFPRAAARVQGAARAAMGAEMAARRGLR
jgi:hemerythrin-like domain-containing protein